MKSNTVQSVNGVKPDSSGNVETSPVAATLNIVGETRGTTSISILSADSEITKSGSGDNVTYSFSPYPRVSWSLTHAVGTYAKVTGSNPIDLSQENTITIGESESTVREGEIINNVQLFGDSASIAKYYDSVNKTLSEDAYTYLRTVKIGICPNLFLGEELSSIDFSFLDLSECTNATNLFSIYSLSKSIQTLSGVTFPKVTVVANMFNSSSGYGCWQLTDLEFPEVTSVRYMFQKSNVQYIKNISLPKVTDMSSMFYGVSATTLDLSSFDTSKVTDMSNMFRDSYSLTTLDLSSFDTSKVTDMSNMFQNSYNLTTLDLSSFDTSKVTDMSNMFYGLSSKCLIICPQGLDMSSVTLRGTKSMFYNSILAKPIHLKNVPSSMIHSGSSSSDWVLGGSYSNGGTQGTHYIIDSVLG